VPVKLLLDGQQVAAQEVQLPKKEGNEIRIVVDAPTTPGEKKLTLRIDPQPGEINNANNDFTTYLTVTKEGLSVLLVDRAKTTKSSSVGP